LKRLTKINTILNANWNNNTSAVIGILTSLNNFKEGVHIVPDQEAADKLTEEYRAILNKLSSVMIMVADPETKRQNIEAVSRLRPYYDGANEIEKFGIQLFEALADKYGDLLPQENLLNYVDTFENTLRYSLGLRAEEAVPRRSKLAGDASRVTKTGDTFTVIVDGKPVTGVRPTYGGTYVYKSKGKTFHLNEANAANIDAFIRDNNLPDPLSKIKMTYD
jgi:hypothetical protein